MSSRRGFFTTFAFGLLLILTALAIFFDTPYSMAIRDSAGFLIDRVTSLFAFDTVSEVGALLNSLGLAGAIAATLLYAVGAMIAFPSSIMTLVCVLAFGYGAVFVTGFGAFLGLAGSFFVARTFFQRHIDWFCTRYPVTRGIENALQSNGFWLVFLMRQSPIIPFAAQNYMFGMLQTRARDYLLGSGLGIVPGTIAKVYVFEGAASAVTDGLSPVQIALVTIGITATLAVMAIVSRFVRRELNAQIS
ncbi:MAG: VTT domain-containing protein [Pseudomonadota bacterium]